MRRRHFIAGAGAAAAAGALGATARAQVPPGQQPIYPINPYPQQFLQQISLGVNVTLSGDLQKYGQEVVKGVQAAVDEQNRFNAPISHVWALRTYDDRNDPGQAAVNVSVASSDSTVVGMIGNLTGPMTLAALSRYANQNFAVIVPTVTADAVTARGYHNVYRLPTKDSTAGRLFANTVLGKRGEPVLAIAFDSDYGYDVARGFVQQAKTSGHPADVLLFPAGKTDPAQAARTVLDRSPGYVFLCGKTGDLGPVAEALRLAGYTGDFGASDGFYNMQTIQGYARTLDGALVASSMPPLDRIPTSIQLVTDFEREVTQVTAFSAYSYAAAQLLIAASQRGNNSATTRTQLLLSLQEGGTFTTLVGQFSFNISGDPLIPNIFLYTITKDGFKYARPAIHNGFIL
jgi:ABC-type branched-subunit amino acid transport system substrate-binding protein